MGGKSGGAFYGGKASSGFGRGVLFYFSITGKLVGGGGRGHVRLTFKSEHFFSFSLLFCPHNHPAKFRDGRALTGAGPRLLLSLALPSLEQCPTSSMNRRLRPTQQSSLQGGEVPLSSYRHLLGFDPTGQNLVI